MTRWAAIHYRDFWDFPHMFVFDDSGQTYLFDSSFDDTIDDYSEEFTIYLMPTLTPADLDGSWAGLPKRSLAVIGRVTTTDVRFDPTKRQFVDASILDRLTQRSALAPG